MNELCKDIKKYMHNYALDNFWMTISRYMINSIDKLPVNNDSFLNFITLFESIDDKTSEIYYNIDFSKCFYQLINLDSLQLKLLWRFLDYVKNNLNADDLGLFQDMIYRGKTDTKWLLEVDYLYQNLVKTISQTEPLSRYEILSPDSNKGLTDQNEYFINLLSNINLIEIDDSELLGFIQGGDFHYISDKAYYYVLPACMKLCIDTFRKNTYPYSLTEEMEVFLEAKYRALHADVPIKELVNNFIELLSNDSYFFLSFSDYNVEMLKTIWSIE